MYIDHVGVLALKGLLKPIPIPLYFPWDGLLKLFTIYMVKPVGSLLYCDTHACGLCATSLFLTHFDVTCDLLLIRRTATWNLFVK